MRTWRALAFGVAAIAAGGCKESKDGRDKPGGDGGGSPAEVRIALGDCASQHSRFESGPRPRPTRDVIADEGALDRIAALDGSGDDRADDAGGTGTKMALDEGKMGTPDSTRQTGRYAILGTLGDPGNAARHAGILGTLSTSPAGYASIHGSADFSSGLDDADVYGGLLGARGARSGLIGRRRFSPRITIGAATATGDLDKHIIRRYVRRQLRRISACYEKQLASNPGLSGTVTAEFKIAATGKVAGARATGMDTKVADCVAETIAEIQFPKPKGGGFVNVRYPFSFKNADGQTAPPRPEAAAGAGAGAAEGAPAAEGAKPKPHGPYVAGANNPLAAVEASIEACVNKSDSRYGVAVVELTAGPDGALTATAAEGVDDSLAACLASAARGLELPASDRPERIYRCPLAFGDMPIDRAPGIDITDKVVRVDGKEIARIQQDIIESSPLEYQVRPLVEHLRARRKERDAAGDVVAITGPQVLRPVASTSGTVLLRVYRSAAAAGDTPLLAAERGGAWTLLRDDVRPPIAPVRLHSGGSWFHRAGLGGVGPRRRVSILVGKGTLRAGTTGGERHDLASAAELGARLSAFRKLDGFADVRTVEIGLEADATYGAAVEAIDAAKKAGFTRWALVEPDTLSVRFKE